MQENPLFPFDTNLVTSTASLDMVMKNQNIASTGNITPVFQLLSSHFIGRAPRDHISYSYKHFTNNASLLTAVTDEVCQQFYFENLWRSSVSFL